MMTFDAVDGTGFAAIAEVPIHHARWVKPARGAGWIEPTPHVWTPDQAVIQPGPVWVVCARTRSGHPSLRVYPLACQDGAPLVWAGAAGVVAGGSMPVTRRQVLLVGGLALLAAVVGVGCTRPPVYEAPRYVVGAYSPERAGALVAAPHAGVGIYEAPRP